jgi:BON domain
MTEDTQKKKRQNRQYVVELEEPGNHGLAYTLGALGGLAVAGLIARGFGLRERAQPPRSEGAAPAQPRPQGAAAARPGRLRREPADLDDLLMLEDAVLDAFMDDEVLGGRGIDVGCISRGIVELSGSVFTRDEAMRAVALAQGVQGVRTVVNRMEIEDERARLHPQFDADHQVDSDEEGFEMSGAEWTGNQSGMGRRRQGRDTDPDRPDDSRQQIEEAIEQADRAQFADEGHYGWPRVGERDEVQEANRTSYSEDELDNQSPFGKHAVPQSNQDDGPPQTFNSQARVGEGLKPGTELRLEQSDVPVKPHQHPSTDQPS